MNTTNTNYFSGQGIVLVARHETNGKLGKWLDLGNVPKLAIETNVSTKEHKESRTGQRLTDKKIITEKKVNVKFTIEELTKANLAMAFQGVIEKITTNSVVDEESRDDMEEGDFWVLNHVDVSSLTIKDNTSQPLVENTDYKVNLKYGRIELLKKGSLQMPLKASYTYANSEKIRFMQDSVGEYALRFEGLNTAEGDRPVLVEVKKISLDPAKTFDLINDDFTSIDIEGEALSVGGETVAVTQLS